MTCPLCTADAQFYFRDEKLDRRYFRCAICDLRFLDPAKHLAASEELARYELHKNDITDVRYQDYMRPIADWIQTRTTFRSHGLDFGCGKAALLAQMLNAKNYEMQIFDPYYCPDKTYQTKKYDFCVAVETAEHFYSPSYEFGHLKGLLKDTGGLGIVTALFHANINFSSWYYRLDPTHVCFYSTRTFDWIKCELGFLHYETDGIRLNWLSR